MTDENPSSDTVEAVRADVVDVQVSERLRTMLTTIGILAFGFMLGVHYFAAQTFGILPPPSVFQTDYASLQGIYNTAMAGGAAAASLGLVGGFLLEFRRRDTE